MPYVGESTCVAMLSTLDTFRFSNKSDELSVLEASTLAIQCTTVFRLMIRFLIAVLMYCVNIKTLSPKKKIIITLKRLIEQQRMI